MNRLILNIILKNQFKSVDLRLFHDLGAWTKTGKDAIKTTCKEILAEIRTVLLGPISPTGHNK